MSLPPGRYFVSWRLHSDRLCSDTLPACRTATGGKFPPNGIYFQANEVFADHSSSHHPITIPRECIGMLDRSIVYFGSSIHSITRGYVCARGFCQTTRTPMRLCNTLHVTSTVKIKALKKQGEEKHAKRVRPNRHLRWTDLIVAWHSCVQIVAD